jgi:hypothetical protein
MPTVASGDALRAHKVPEAADRQHDHKGRLPSRGNRCTAASAAARYTRCGSMPAWRQRPDTAWPAGPRAGCG